MIKREMEYCMQHPEEVSKMAAVQRKVGSRAVVELACLHACAHCSACGPADAPFSRSPQRAHACARCAPCTPIAGTQVDAVKSVMAANVAQVLVRDEKVDVLVNKSDDLRDQVVMRTAGRVHACGGRHRH